MDLLTAVNRILPVLGEHPVTSLDTKHPTLAILIPKIAAKVDDILMPGWWFNQFDTTLYPDSQGGIALPTDTLSFVPTYDQAVQRGTALYNPVTLNYIWDHAIDGSIIQRVPFELLPESAAIWAMYSTMVVTYVTDIGFESSVQLWQTEVRNAEGNVLAEHLRQMKYSTRRSKRYQKIIRSMRA